MLQPAKPDFAGEVRPQRLGGREGATQLQKRIFCYEMYYKHDLPHDVG